MADEKTPKDYAEEILNGEKVAQTSKELIPDGTFEIIAGSMKLPKMVLLMNDPERFQKIIEAEQQYLDVVFHLIKDMVGPDLVNDLEAKMPAITDILEERKKEA